MKILFINLPYHGHFMPTIGLVRELIKQGCAVTYLMPFDWKEHVYESGADFAGYENHRKLSEQIKNAYAAADRVAKDYDMIVYEQFFFLGKHLVEKHGKPAVRIFTAPATNGKLMKEYICAGGALGIFKHKWICKLWTKDIAKGIPMKTDCWLDEIVQNPPALNLVYTLKEYQPYAEDFPEEQYKFLGASVYDRKEQNIDFKKTNLPVIYISLGTIVKGAVSFFEKCIEAFRNEQVDVIMSVGKGFPIHKLKNIPKNYRIYNEVPQLSVLKQADIFVTHGGMNSVSEALVHGVPMVVIPFMSEQPTNARRIEELGLGKKLDYSTINSESLKTTVLSVMKDEGILANVSRIQRKMLDAPGNRGGAAMIIDFYEKVSR
ncbi:nucleotide disphospho-sugar-binding domain-containing protein [Acetivibrio straminisolvens]|jgi:MGT family glycosyltransferase|nr:nucleotide disphospho-sugar-binding domain-containing protein [Acetivibrio straminisolvens]